MVGIGRLSWLTCPRPPVGPSGRGPPVRRHTEGAMRWPRHHATSGENLSVSLPVVIVFAFIRSPHTGRTGLTRKGLQSKAYISTVPLEYKNNHFFRVPTWELLKRVNQYANKEISVKWIKMEYNSSIHSFLRPTDSMQIYQYTQVQLYQLY